MGVSWIVNIPMEESRGTQQVLEGLAERLLALGAEKGGLHNVDCDVYQSMITQSPNTVCLMHSTEYPITSFAFLDNNSCLTADNIIDLIMMKLKALYDARKNLKVECKGSRFTLQDFVFKTGAVHLTNSNSVLGVLLEVEYLPSVMSSNCLSLLKEMVQGIVGRPVEIPNYLKLQANENYLPNHTMQQYLEQFNTLKKAHISSQGHIPQQQM
ncbi:mediator of RNA polymerase II transcription subunit 20-like [Watersipora subatra]|uniref:mediator of RNA polymerase II transcription subunit 20-like n=1 Tax=Watersipora subatra TaxID=2589382 RepID=UPI00355B7921